MIISRSLLEMLVPSSDKMALASTSLMNRSRKWSRTCCAAQKGESCYTQTCQLLMLLVGPPCAFQEDQWCVVIQGQYNAKCSSMHITFTQLLYTVYSHSELEAACKHKYVLHQEYKTAYPSVLHSYSKRTQ